MVEGPQNTSDSLTLYFFICTYIYIYITAFFSHLKLPLGTPPSDWPLWKCFLSPWPETQLRYDGLTCGDLSWAPEDRGTDAWSGSEPRCGHERQRQDAPAHGSQAWWPGTMKSWRIHRVRQLNTV